MVDTHSPMSETCHTAKEEKNAQGSNSQSNYVAQLLSGIFSGRRRVKTFVNFFRRLGIDVCKITIVCLRAHFNKCTFVSRKIEFRGGK